jgi:secreted trypsin-like serine protease
MTMGCSATSASSPEEHIADSESAIVDGAETTDFPGIVALYGKKPGEEKGALCTASVVAPTVLLTAAHCVASSTVGDGLVFKAFAGNSLVDSVTPPTKIDVAEVHWDPQFDPQAVTNGHDIAVVILAHPVSVSPLRINRASLPNLSTARLVGYGLNDGREQTGAGVKRTAEVPVRSIDDKFVVTGSWFGATMCSGDSGGPVLATIEGEQRIIGINSFGFMQCIGTGSSTRVDSYLSFIDQYVH